jgi:hypothetical protein
MPLTINSEVLRIDGITSIEVSDDVADPDSGGYTRKIEFYTDPLDSTNRRPVLTVLSYGDKPNLLITTPTLKF